MSRDLDGDDPRLAALAYATVMGWCVVPIPAGQKHPSVLDWPNAATTDVDTIKRWWDEDPTANIGIVTGPRSGIFVLDVDEHGAESGSDTLADLIATYGALPDTPIVLTGGGGAHYYFRYPEGVTIVNDAGMRLGPGIDIRADGGQVVAPPSLHANGRHYTWDASFVPSPHDTVFDLASDEIAVADAPAWLIELLTQAPPERERKPAEPKGEPRLPGEKWAAETDWGDLLAADGATFMGARRDHRSDTTYELWARPGQDDHASASLGYGGSDVLKVFSTNWPGLDAGATYTKFGYFAATRHGGNHADARADLERQGYVAEKVTLEDLIAKAEEEAKDEDDDPLPGLGIHSLTSLFEGDIPEYNWLVPGLIERGDRIIITGDEGHGKSTLLRQMGLAAAIGRNPFARTPDETTHAPCRVLMIDCENSERQLRREFPKALGPLRDVYEVAPNFHYALRTAGLALDDESDREGDRLWLARAVVALDPDLLIIGPLYKLLAGDPNAEPENRETAKFLDKLRRQARMAMLIEAHAPHGQKRPYGWSGWKRWPEFGYHLSAEHMLIPFRGARDDSRWWPPVLRRGNIAEGEWPWMPTDEARAAGVDSAAEYEATTRMLIIRELKATGRRMTLRALTERTKRPQPSVIQAIRHMEDTGGWLVASEMSVVRNGREITTEAWALDIEGHAFD